MVLFIFHDKALHLGGFELWILDPALVQPQLI